MQAGETIGGYTLIKLLGRGGMGDVWLANDPKIERRAALKFINARYLEDLVFRRRFLDEAKLLGRLRHDRIVALFAVIDEDPYLALALEFIQGPGGPDKGTSLFDRIEAEGALPIDFVKESARDILPALAHAHEHGVIHRDIKPHNVLLDRKSRSFLTDFGIAVGDTAERLTRVGAMIGSPPYMSPEQIQAPWTINTENKGYRTDIYSYGILLYEMLSGQLPFNAETDAELQRSQCQDCAPPLREINELVPAALEEVVFRCLEKRPDDRYQSCTDLLKDLEAATSDKKATVVQPRMDYARTVVERPAGAPVDNPPVQPRPLQTPGKPSKSKNLPRWIWPIAGLLLLAGGITFVMRPDKPKTTAAEYYTIANQDWNQHKYCEGKDPIDNAVRLAPGSGPYADLQKRLAQGCEAKGYYDKAVQLFNARNCEGKLTIQKAIDLAPQDTSFQELKSKFTFCEAPAPSAKRRPSAGKPVVDNSPPVVDNQAIVLAAREAADGKQAYENGDYCGGAVPHFEKAVALAPANPGYKTDLESARKGCNAQR